MATCDLTCSSLYHLYKVTSQVSLMTAVIEQDHFLYLSSFMNTYFSGNVFKFLIFFTLFTLNKRVLNLACSVVIGCSPLMSPFMCTRSVNSGSSLSWQRKLMIPTKPDWSGLVLSTQNVSYNSEFVHLQSWYRPLQKWEFSEEISLLILKVLTFIWFSSCFSHFYTAKAGIFLKHFLQIYVKAEAGVWDRA